MQDQPFKKLQEYMIQMKPFVQSYLILCIGNSEISGDSFGPMVGSNLKQLVKKRKDIQIIGNMQNNLSYSKINTLVQTDYPKACVIAIDSALSKTISIGNIIVEKRGACIGSAFGKKEYILGNISIKAVIAPYQKSEIKNWKNICNVPRQFISELANLTTHQLYQLIQEI